MPASLLDDFATLEDPRVERNQRHALLDILLLTVCAVVSGAEGWEVIEEFGREKLDWLCRFALFENGVPSHDRIANSIPAQAKTFAHAVRGRRGVESPLHWRLDVIFREDASGIRKANAPATMMAIRHLSLNLLEQEPSKLRMS